MDIDALWEYSDPGESERRFRTALAHAEGDGRLELLTQIARTYSLRCRFDDARAVLAQIEEALAASGPRPRIRHALELGRTCNSSGDRTTARPHFERAWRDASAAGEEGLAVDAAHMIAIACAGTPESLAWNERGLVVARGSPDPKARALVPAMLNNSAWELHGEGRFEEALARFEEALDAGTATGRADRIRIARWSVARCLRSLGRHDEALAIQRELASEHEAAGTHDGYIDEEIGENLWALGRQEEARPHFARAAESLTSELDAERLRKLRDRPSGPFD
jgi:tetratricopeptide (TPR) repeat protein